MKQRTLLAVMAFFILVGLVLWSNQATAQVNAYAKVTNITGGNTLNIGVFSEAHHSFQAGGQVIIFQMQDDVIGSNTGNDVNFGLLADIQQVGRYEVAQIATVHRAGPNLNSIVLAGPLQYTYPTGANSSVQVVSFPTLGSPDYTTTGPITAVPWNGNFGGVVAFRVNGRLIIQHAVHADGAGFRGGASNGGGSGSCAPNANFRVNQQDNFADKGEGIYKSTNSNYAAGRARILSGGGGGNSHNAGGGGGSHFTAGGEGGPGWVCSPGAGGLGGVDLGIYTTVNRIFMGGGGGAGEANNGANTAGGTGGGIVLIKANQIETAGTIAGLRISAHGASTANSNGDGAGGGGAAGTVYIETNSWSISSTAPLTIGANGGNGGNVTHNDQHGGGGGGGQGVVMLTTNPAANLTLQTNSGVGGRNMNSGASAGNGGGTQGAGVKTQINGILPVGLVRFSGWVSSPNNGGTKKHMLGWQIDGWTPTAVFTVEAVLASNSSSSVSGPVAFTAVGRVEAHAFQRKLSNTQAVYEWEAKESSNWSGEVLYRLRIEESGMPVRYSGMVRLSGLGSGGNTISNSNNGLNLKLYPNPVVHQNLNVLFEVSGTGSSGGNGAEMVNYQVIGTIGQVLKSGQWRLPSSSSDLRTQHTQVISLTGVPPGVYVLRMVYQGRVQAATFRVE
jgi:hypothetical protein